VATLRVALSARVAGWYKEHLSRDDTYHAKVILPNLRRMLALKNGERVLDAACGEGYFTRSLAPEGASIIGADVSPELIALARGSSPKNTFHAAPIEKLSFGKDGEFDKAFCVLALQNIEHLDEALKEIARVVKKEGEFIFVLNHPCFRIPKRSEWGFDETKKVQYRRIDGYLSESRAEIDMHPGTSAAGKVSPVTYSFHRPLQVYVKALAKHGLHIVRLEEWISHKKSEPGPRAAAEDAARKEFPLFLALVARKA
jgi:SAM-dependent methyltransferase